MKCCLFLFYVTICYVAFLLHGISFVLHLTANPYFILFRFSTLLLLNLLFATQQITFNILITQTLNGFIIVLQYCFLLYGRSFCLMLMVFYLFIGPAVCNMGVLVYRFVVLLVSEKMSEALTEVEALVACVLYMEDLRIYM